MVSREDLYELVWSIPMIKVAEKFSVSGSYMARVCSILNVPRPERGYWAKLQVEKASARPALPEALPGDPLFWSQDGDPSVSRVYAVTATSAPAQPRTRRVVAGIHGLIQGAKQHYERGYKIEEGQLLRPYKRQLVDVTASAMGLDKALAFANDLFNALESIGHRVRFAASNERLHRPHVDEHEKIPKPKRQEYSYSDSNQWQPSSPTVVYVGAIPFGLAVIEMTEAILMRHVNGKYIRESEYKPPKTSRSYTDHTWTTTKNIPSGRLRLVVYSPQRDVSWSIMFQETVDRTLTQDIAKIVKSIEDSTEVMRKEIIEAEQRAEVQRREWEEQNARWERERDQQQIADSAKKSREQLAEVIQSWATVMSIEQFLMGVEERAIALPETQRGQVLDRLQLAREFLGTQDPLECFNSWKTPSERYIPLAKRNPQFESAEDDKKLKREESHPVGDNERMSAAKPKKKPMESSSQRNSSEIKDIEALLKKIETLEAGNASLRHQLSVFRDQPRSQERSADLSERERRHLFMKYSHVRRY